MDIHSDTAPFDFKTVRAWFALNNATISTDDSHAYLHWWGTAEAPLVARARASVCPSAAWLTIDAGTWIISVKVVAREPVVEMKFLGSITSDGKLQF